MSKVFLKIGSTEFIGELTPNAIAPSIEIIKNEERSVSGKMNVDIVARKVKLQISWSYVSNNDIGKIISIANSMAPVKVEYYDANDTTVVKDNKKTITAYPSNITYSPLFLSDELKWRDVSLEMIEM